MPGTDCDARIIDGLLEQIGGDGFNGDTMGFAPKNFANLDSKTGHAPLVRNQLALSPPLRFAATCLSYSIVICLAQVGPGAFCAQVFPQFGRNFPPERKAKFGRNLGVCDAQ